MSTVTMQELELETAELLPARETLCVHKSPSSSSSVTNITNIGNTSQNGLVNVSAFNGEGNSRQHPQQRSASVTPSCSTCRRARTASLLRITRGGTRSR